MNNTILNITFFFGFALTFFFLYCQFYEVLSKTKKLTYFCKNNKDLKTEIPLREQERQKIIKDIFSEDLQSILLLLLVFNVCLFLGTSLLEQFLPQSDSKSILAAIFIYGLYASIAATTIQYVVVITTFINRKKFP